MLRSMPSGWSIGGFGLTPWGGGPVGSFEVVGAEPVAENVVRVAFSEKPFSDGVGSIADATVADHYAVAAISGTGIDGKPIRPVLVIAAMLVPGSPTAIDVVVDRPFSPWPCEYRVAANSLRGSVSGLPLTVGATSWAFKGLLRTVESQSRDLAVKNRDVSNPQNMAATLDPLPDPIGAVLGSYNTDTAGDYAFDEGVTSYRKRIFRRIYCRKGKFVFLPTTWGLGIQDELKRLNTAAKRESIRLDLEKQILSEPETAECSVTTLLSRSNGAIVRYHIRSKMRDGRGVDMTVPFQVG